MGLVMGLFDEFSNQCLDPVVQSLAPAAAIMIKEQREKDMIHAKWMLCSLRDSVTQGRDR